MDATPASRTFRIGLALVVALIAGVQLGPYLTWSPEKLTTHGMLIDDAFFYSTVASNWLEHGFPSLDGEMPTNGFQPLWMGVQVVLQALFDVDPIRLVAVGSWCAYVAFAFAMSFLMSRGSRLESLVRVAVLGALVVANPGFQTLVVQGLEVPLALLLIVATTFGGIRAFAYRRPASVGRDVTFAVLAALTFLARTDLFWVPAGCALLLWMPGRDRSRARALRFCLVLAVLVLPYLVWNATQYGSPIPVSGRVKVHYLHSFHPTFSRYLASDSWMGLAHALRTPLSALLGAIPTLGLSSAARWLPGVAALVGIVAFAVTAPARKRLQPWIGLLLFGCIAHVLVMYVWHRELRPYTAYYFAPEVLTIGSLLAAFVGREFARAWPMRRRIAAVGVVVLTLLCIRANQLAVLNRVPGPFWETRLQMARELPEHLATPDRVGAFWPGVFAGFSGVRVTPLDGIIGSQDYFENHVKPGTELDYARAHGIRDVVVFLPDGPASVTAEEPPLIAQWSHLGVRRLWEQRDRCHVVHAVPIDASGAGWYLFRLD